jgi:iron complex outermembrane receptor protein
MRQILLGAISPLVVCALAASPALAQPAQTNVRSQDATEPEDEIVITAQRREERSVDVPITVTTLGAELLQTANVEQLSDIAKITPAMRFDYAGGYFQPTIRGIGTAVVTSGGGGNVGIYVDGFYSPNPLAADFDLMRVRSIQVLKGPQGTLFGRNTTGGAILVQTAEPSTETGADFKVSWGRYKEAKAQGYATFGITDKIAFDAEGQVRWGNGWRTNISNGRRVGDFKNWSVRTGLKWNLTDSISVLLRYQHSQIDDPSPLLTASYFGPDVGSGAPFLAQPSQVTFKHNEIASGTNPSDQEFYRGNNDVYQATIRADLGFANFTSYTQYRDEKADSSIELDYSGLELIQLGLPNFNKTFSQEFLFTSKPGGSLQWTAGLFYFSNRDTYKVFFDYFPIIGIFSRGAEFGSSSTVKSLAAFLDATYEVTPKLFITAGARYAHDKETDVYSICAFCARVDADAADYDAVNKKRLTPRFVVRYKPTQRSSIYASFTKGYKAALLDLGRGFPNPVKPETITAYEVGFKYDARKISFETAGFYYDYKDLQVSIYEQGQASIINAASSEIYGLEGQIRYDFNDNFQISAGAAWVHGRYKTFENAPVYERCLPVGSCGLDTFRISGPTLRNVTMQRTPAFTGNIAARYRTELAGGELELSGNLYYTSKFFFGPSGIQFPQKGYEILGLRAQWTDPSERFTVGIWGDNVTNSRYQTQVQYNLPGIGANWSKPVTFGVDARVRLGR